MTVTLSHAGKVVTLSVTPPGVAADPEHYVSALEQIGQIAQPFVLRASILSPIDLPQDQRKAQNMWFKRSRDDMNRHCRAAAVLRLTVSEKSQQTFQGLWDFPVLVTDDAAEADAFLDEHLRGLGEQ